DLRFGVVHKQNLLFCQNLFEIRPQHIQCRGGILQKLLHKFPLAGLLTPGENTLTLTLTGSSANRYGKHPVPYGLDT
ncbi:hypothetical protein, partial [Gemmiger sp.]|uniref:hypothetical protein n=1 Tax=Gemmiger sp. TaxID=2049027 RepID=UPI003AB71BDA